MYLNMTTSVNYSFILTLALIYTQTCYSISVVCIAKKERKKERSDLIGILNL